MDLQSMHDINNLINPATKPLKNTFSMKQIIGRGESAKHSTLKHYACMLLRKQGYDFFTEAKLINGKVPDIIILSLGCCIEVQVTEKDKSIELKRENYLGLRVYGIKCKRDIEICLGTNLDS